MGAAQSYWQWLGGWGSLPDHRRETYFQDALKMGWQELLCCPSPMGCTVVAFEQNDPMGGKPLYKVKLRLSHSRHVPRYQMHVMKDMQTLPWVVGHMEKTETHLRAKPGEFVRAQIWQLTSNSIVQERRRSALQRKNTFCFKAVQWRPTPSADDMKAHKVAISSQAKIDQKDAKLNLDSERWLQSMGIDSRLYKVSIEPPHGMTKWHHDPRSISVMRILYRGKTVCIAKKQRFAGTLGKLEQPFLGVQIKPSAEGEQSLGHPSGDQSGLTSDPPYIGPLDTEGLMMLLMCLAWSEETMSPHTDMSARFIDAMRAPMNAADSAAGLGLSVQWDTEEMKQRLKHAEHYLQLHNWNLEDERDLRVEDEEEAEMDTMETKISVGPQPSTLASVTMQQSPSRQAEGETPKRNVSFSMGDIAADGRV